MDISSLLKTAGVDSERTATKLFGNAVEQFAAGPLNSQLKSSFDTPAASTVNRTGGDGSWYSTSYAHSLADSQFRPKLRFLFRVEFLFKPDVLKQFSAETSNWLRNFTFLIKSVDRPKVDFEYEDINQYNFRTKVLKTIKHRALTMTFLDDVGNNVHEFFRFMMFVHSPITRRSIDVDSFDIAGAWAQYSTGNGMKFSGADGKNDFAHRGVLESDVGNAIQAIKVTQMFIQPGSSREDLSTNAKEVAFLFINPRIDSFDLDEVSHDSNDPNVFTMAFDYDFMVMSGMRVLQPVDSSKAMPPVGSAPGEVVPAGGGSSKSAQGGNNPYTSMLAAIGGRATQKLTSEYFGRAIQAVPGLGSVADGIGGLVNKSASAGIGGLLNKVNQSFAQPTSRPVVTDSAVAGPVDATYTKGQM